MEANFELLNRLGHEIAIAIAESNVTAATTVMADSRDEIERLNVCLNTCAAETERLLRWINQTRGEKIEILHKKIA